MGDRSNCTRLDRTNGFDDGRDYVRVKKSKLAQQNDQLRDALRSRNNLSRTELFKGISFNVNGRTQPTADELKRLILLNGGDYHPYYKYQSTKFMIATNLSTARIKGLRPDDRVVRPEWILESIKAKKLLPHEEYQIYSNETRGKTGSVLAIETSSNSCDPTIEPAPTAASSLAVALAPSQTTQQAELQPQALTYTTNYRRSSSNKKVNHPPTKSRDIRTMFSQSARNPLASQGPSKKDDGWSNEISSSQSSNGCISSKSDDPPSQDKDKAQLPPSQTSTDSKEQTSSKRKRSHTNATTTKTTIDESQPAKLRALTGDSAAAKLGCKPISDFIVKGTRFNQFPAPKVPTRAVPNICGLTGLNEIIELINEWVGCPEGVLDEDTACVTKYFLDLMGEKDYHNKFFEVIFALQQRVLQHGDVAWMRLYNDLAKTLKNELNQNSEASQSLYQLISLIDLPQDDHANPLDSRLSPKSEDEHFPTPTLPPIAEVD